MIELALGLAPALVLLCYMLWVDRRQPEPFNELLFALLVGAVSTLFSFCFSTPAGMLGLLPETNTTILDAFRTSFFGAGVPEELAKLILLYLLVKKNKFFDERIDGLVYAACIGLGFAGLENVLYLAEAGDAMAQTAIMRALLSVPGHFCFALFMGYWFSKWWWSKDETHPNRKTIYLVYAFVIPVLIHTAYDWICFSNDIISGGNEVVSTAIVILLFIFCGFFHKLARKRTMSCLNEDMKQSIADKAQMNLGEYDPEQKYAIYSKTQINVCSLLCSPLAGIMLASHNCDVYGDLKGKNRIWMWGTLAFFLCMIAAFAYDVPVMMFLALPLILCIIFIVDKTHTDLIPAENIVKKRKRDCIGRSLLGLLFSWLMILLIIVPVNASEEREQLAQHEQEVNECFEKLINGEPTELDITSADEARAEELCAAAVGIWQSGDEENFALADKMIKKAVTKTSDITIIIWLNQIAYLYRGENRIEEAVIVLEHAILLFPDEANLYDSCGEMYYLMGRKEEALEMWHEVLKHDPDFLDSQINHETDLTRYLKEDGLLEASEE